MPYISIPDRIALDGAIDELHKVLEKRGLKDGDINYCISTIFFRVFRKNPSYGLLARLTGVLVNVKDEFYRRCGVPYEDMKCQENGDLY